MIPNNHTKCPSRLMALSLSLLIALSCPHQGAAQSPKKGEPPTLHPAPIDLGLLYPLSTGGHAARTADTHFSLQLLRGVSGGLSGLAVSGLLEQIQQDAGGALIAGMGNQVRGRAHGAQIAGLFNRLDDRAAGSAVGGLFNYTAAYQGIQIAGLMNHAGDIHGLQMAGLINIARRVKGVQLSGLVNVADSSDYPIGLVNLIKKGSRRLVLSTDTRAHTLLGFQSGGRVLYGRLGLGYRISQSEGAYLLEAAIGAHLYRSLQAFRLDAEVRQLVATDFTHGHMYTHSLRLLPAFKLGPRFQLFAGPELSLILDYSHQRLSGEAPYFWKSHGPGGHFIGGSWGAVAGLHLLL